MTEDGRIKREEHGRTRAEFPYSLVVVQKENGLSGMSKPIGAEELQRRMLGPEPGKAKAESFRDSADLGITLWTNNPSTLSL